MAGGINHPPTAVGCLRITVRLNTAVAVAINLAAAVVSFLAAVRVHYCFVPDCHVNLLFGRPEIMA
jgi:hypothetical protein